MKNSTAKIIAILLASCSSALLAQFPPVHSYHADPQGNTERNRNIDVTHMKLQASFETKQKKVMGTVTHQFISLQNNVDTIFLHAPGIIILDAKLDGKAITFKASPGGLTINSALKNDFQKKHQLEITYNAFPKKGLYFIGWDLPEITEPSDMSRRQIWTQGQGIDNRNWIPMIDDRSDKFTTETIITFDQDYQVLSNGQLLKTTQNKDNTKTWHYSLNKPHAGYLLMLAIDKYAVKKSVSKKGVPMQFWYYPEHPERVEPTSRYSEEIIDFLADEIGVPYPWGTYSQVMVQDFLYGAMENTSATIFGDFFWVDNRAYLLNRNYVSVNAHEATHQWFGDLITGRKDNEQWLQESFATYYPGLFEGHQFSEDHMYWYFRNNQLGAIQAGKANSLPVRHSQSGSSRHYPKGASVLHMLQHQVGRDNFRRAIQLYLKRHQFEGVETWDLQKAFIDATGINVDAFFDQWIHRGGEPIFDVQVRKSATQTTFLIKQIQTIDAVVSFFSTPVDLAIYYTDGSVDRKTVEVSGASNTFDFATNGKTVSYCLFDEGSFLLKELKFNKTTEELLSQAQTATFMLDRYDAWLELRTVPMSVKWEALKTAFSKETFPNLRAEIASQMMDNPGIDAQTITLISRDKQAEVRLIFAQKTPLVSATQPFVEALLFDSSYVIINTVIDRIWEHPLYANRKNFILDAIKKTDGFCHDIKVRYFELGTEIYPEMAPGMTKALVNISGPMYEFRTRINAMNALQRMNYLNKDFAFALFEGSINFNSRLNGPAQSLIKYYAKQTQKRRELQEFLKDYKCNDVQKKQLLGLIIGS